MAASQSVLLDGPSALIRCPLCDKEVKGKLRIHVLSAHGRQGLRDAVLADKRRGVSDPELGARYGVSHTTLERYITETYGANVSALTRPKQVKRWQPRNFREESTSVWSFRQRGDWATHDGRYRGNWSPYIPRNVILKYSRVGDTVMDYFVGGGTTAVEAKLLGRRCLARDINPAAVQMTLRALDFRTARRLIDDEAEVLFEPEVRVGDARDLSDVQSSSIDLICAHPPYAGIIKYGTGLAGDLSALPVESFLAEMAKVASESYRVLKPGGKCAILIGDARKSRHVVPIGFQTIRVFLDAGFVLKELVVKRQHNCKTTGFWHSRSIKHNFLLLAHEYLPVFEKAPQGPGFESLVAEDSRLGYGFLRYRGGAAPEGDLETTTVWVFPPDTLQRDLLRNCVCRFCPQGDALLVTLGANNQRGLGEFQRPTGLVFVQWPHRSQMTESRFWGYWRSTSRFLEQAGPLLAKGSFLVLEAKDFRSREALWPSGLILREGMARHTDFALKEIVVVLPEGGNHHPVQAELDIVHRYLLVYVRK